MSLTALYREKIQEKGFAEDPAQLAVIKEMQCIADALANRGEARPAPEKKSGFLGRLLGAAQEPQQPAWIKGLYCWGGVGRGKTFLMDLFMEYLPTERKRRRHFHRFMLEINDALNALEQVQNPMDAVVRRLSEEIDVLCLDEFFVSDITHAMILDRLLTAMQKYGVTIVTTSNIVPDDLYKNGLQRERFLPAIAWIKENLTVLHIADGEDFRRRHFSMDSVFRTPADAENLTAMQADLAELSGAPLQKSSGAFQAGSRQIPLLAAGEKAVLFDFADLCKGNYSQKDYIEIAKEYGYAGLANVPVLDEFSEDAAKRFLLLIDEFYDRRVKLLITAAAKPEAFYQGKKMAFEYDRLQSRLFEMQSEAYWQEAHLP